MAAENQFWGAPRIHGELLKLGIAVSERTVSRYLPQRRRAPSQNWRTFLTNHLGQLPVLSPALSPYAPGPDDAFDIPSVPLRHMPFVCDGLNTSPQCVLVDSFPRTPCRVPVVRDHWFHRVSICATAAAVTRRHRKTVAADSASLRRGRWVVPHWAFMPNDRATLSVSGRGS
jgi:hypothetical protein